MVTARKVRASAMLLLAVVALATFAHAEDDDVFVDEDKVIVLTDENFDEETKKHQALLVKFYAPWCGHCTAMAPDYKKAALELAADGISIAKLDADKYKDVAGRFGVQGFPTLKLFRFGEEYEAFDGERKLDGIVSYMRKMHPKLKDAAVDKVIDLTPDNFDDVTAQHDALLVEFYAPWCGHCKALAPEYKKAADKLAEDGISIARVDAAEHNKLASKYNANSYPMMFLFRRGQLVEAFDGRKTDDIVSYMKLMKPKMANAIVEVKSPKELKDIMGSLTKPAIMGFFRTTEGVDYRYWNTVASSFGASAAAAELGNVYWTTNDDIMDAQGFMGSGAAIVAFKPGAKKPKRTPFKGKFFKDAIKGFFFDNIVPSVYTQTKDVEKFMKQALPKQARVVVYTDEASIPAVITAIEGKKKQLPKDFRIGVGARGDFSDLVNDKCSGIKDLASAPCVTAQASAKSVMYSDDSQEDTLAYLASGQFEKFIEDFQAKKLKPRLKSEAIPRGEGIFDNGVVHVVGNNFETVVVEGDKNVLIEFYAPWCGHCKSLKPVLEAVAAELKEKDIDDIVIAKMDATANDTPPRLKDQYKVEGFPTMYYVRKGKKGEPMPVDGGRDKETIMKFLLDNRL